MKKLILFVFLITLPSAAFALEQSFTQQGVKATIKLSPEKPETQSNVRLSLGLNKDGTSITDRDVTLEVYERGTEQPVIKRKIDVLDNEYVDSWKFDKAGEYKVILKIADHQQSDGIMQYEVNTSVMDAGGEHGDHGFFPHHFSGKGKWGWWGVGLMLIMMVPMMVLIL